ncbi:Efflux pump [Penicillium chermesinum]|uniref:Efflux pump n=1 Tax=Penicillium chermesinum TaxID=63820 RepID=A0A9W9P8K3_9EURO|nr:Efflux pump [Penicillium chermesinum]KAJ5239516.1 Efflux pump [Penicillium chermesinum]
MSSSAAEIADFQPSRRFYVAFGSLCVVILAAALDATSLSTALPIISHSIHGSAIEAFWAGTSFLLTSTVCQLTFGSLSQSFGRKDLILLSLILFTIGSIVAAVAKDFTTLLIGRSVQGAGGGGIISLTEVVITDLVPLRHRGTWFGYQSAVWAIGSVNGPVIGGALAEAASWRWIFWINLPICAVGFVMTVWFLQLKRVPGGFVSKLVHFDWVGASFLTASSTALLVAISRGNVMYPWSSWHTIVPLVLGVLGLVGFVAYEATIAKDPIIRLAIFRHRTALVSYLGTCIHGILLWCLLYYLPLYYECVKGYNAIVAGVGVFPKHSLWLQRRLCSLGYAIQTAAEEKDVAYAASMYTFSRSFGQSIGVAIGGAIFQAQFAIKLKAYPLLASDADQLSKDASSLVETVKAMDPRSLEKTMIIEAYADSLKVVWATMAGLAFLGLLTSVFTEELTVDRAQESQQQLQEKKPLANEEMLI